MLRSIGEYAENVSVRERSELGHQRSDMRRSSGLRARYSVHMRSILLWAILIVLATAAPSYASVAPDLSFGTNGAVGVAGSAVSVDGEVMAVRWNARGTTTVTRLGADGRQSRDVAVIPERVRALDGSLAVSDRTGSGLFVARDDGVVKLNAMGWTVSPLFQVPVTAQVGDLATTSDGSLFAYGIATGPAYDMGPSDVLRFRSDGAIDTTFGNRGAVKGDSETWATGGADALVPVVDGFLGTNGARLTRSTSSGTLVWKLDLRADTGLQQLFITGIVAGSTDAYYAYGIHYESVRTPRPIVVKFNGAGMVDRSFGSNGLLLAPQGVYGTPTAARVDVTGTLLLLGNEASVGVAQRWLIGFNSDGSADKSIGPAGVQRIAVSGYTERNVLIPGREWLDTDAAGRILIGLTLPDVCQGSTVYGGWYPDEKRARIGRPLSQFESTVIALNHTAQPQPSILSVGHIRVGTKAADRLAAHPGCNVVDGLEGNDILAGGPQRDVLLGGFGDDRIAGGAGPDLVIGGPGSDRLSGGAGNDQVDSNDRSVDTVMCGPGSDRATVDHFDRVSKDCEKIVRF